LRNVSGQLDTFTFMLGYICFISFFFLLILKSLRHYVSILLVALLILFIYEDKRLAQH